jgi:hypothetical protein
MATKMHGKEIDPHKKGAKVVPKGAQERKAGMFGKPATSKKPVKK